MKYTIIIDKNELHVGRRHLVNSLDDDYNKLSDSREGYENSFSSERDIDSTVFNKSNKMKEEEYKQCRVKYGVVLIREDLKILKDQIKYFNLHSIEKELAPSNYQKLKDQIKYLESILKRRKYPQMDEVLARSLEKDLKKIRNGSQWLELAPKSEVTLETANIKYSYGLDGDYLLLENDKPVAIIELKRTMWDLWNTVDSGAVKIISASRVAHENNVKYFFRPSVCDDFQHWQYEYFEKDARNIRLYQNMKKKLKGFPLINFKEIKVPKLYYREPHSASFSMTNLELNLSCLSEEILLIFSKFIP